MISAPSTRTSARFLCCNVGSTNLVTCRNAQALLQYENREARWLARRADPRVAHRPQQPDGCGSALHGPVSLSAAHRLRPRHADDRIELLVTGTLAGLG